MVGKAPGNNLKKKKKYRKEAEEVMVPKNVPPTGFQIGPICDFPDFPMRPACSECIKGLMLSLGQRLPDPTAPWNIIDDIHEVVFRNP